MKMLVFVSVCGLQLAMRGPPGPMGLTGRSGPVVRLLFFKISLFTNCHMTRATRPIGLDEGEAVSKLF